MISSSPLLYQYKNTFFTVNKTSNNNSSNSTHHPKMSSVDGQGVGKRVAVVGAGISGLAAAYKLKLHGLNVTVFEAEGIAGGKLRSVSKNGLIWDEGANTMTESEKEVSYLLDSLGLREKQQFPLAQNKRYIARNGEPVLLPSDPISLFRSNFLSAQSKFQIMLEPFLWKKRDSPKEESVGEFFERHFGKEVVDYLVDPFIAGTSAGDTESLSMRHVFPDLWELDKKYGSIISGAIQSKFSAKKDKSESPKSSPADKKTTRGSFSFSGGMQTLPYTLCKQLEKNELKLETKVLELCYGCNLDSSSENWSIVSAPIKKDIREEQPFDAVIMTAPLSNVREMKIMKRGSPYVLDFLPEVNYLPLSVIITTFRKEDVKKPLEGFGVLIPSKEQQNGLKTLGTLFSSMMFPDRAPSDLHLYTTFVGGSRNRELAKASTEELKQIVTTDLRQLLGVDGEPTFVNHYFWSKAFPQYGHSYDTVLQAIDTIEQNLPGFFYAGNHRGGLSVGKALSSGCIAADHVISYLESASDKKLSHH